METSWDEVDFLPYQREITKFRRPGIAIRFGVLVIGQEENAMPIDELAQRN